MGGFLQSIIYGFAGIRLRPQALEFHNPKPPYGVTRITLNGFKYLGTRMKIDIDEFRVEIYIEHTGDYALVLRKNDTHSPTEETLNQGTPFGVPKQEGIIFCLYASC